MRSSVSFMLSHGSGEVAMSHPDYEQHAHHHGSLLVLVRGIGPAKPRSLQKVFERVQRVNNVRVNADNGVQRDIWVRFVQDHPVENNDWGDFQTHRRLLGLITVGKFDTQAELNELCRVHESLKVKYTSTLYDSRCILFGGAAARPNSHSRSTGRSSAGDDSLPPDSLNSASTSSSSAAKTDPNSRSRSPAALDSETGGKAPASLDSDAFTSIGSGRWSDADGQQSLEQRFSTPSNFKSRAFFYPENDPCDELEAHIGEFVQSLFWILEAKRLERSREKTDRVVLLQAPFEKKDFVGLDLDSRNNRKRCLGRVTKHLADLTLQAGLVADSLTLYQTAGDTLRAISDSLWLGAATEGLCAASALLLFPECRQPAQLHRNASLPSDGVASSHSPNKWRPKVPIVQSPPKAADISTAPDLNSVPVASSPLLNSASSSTSSVSSMLLSSSSSSGTLSASATPNVLPADEIASRYRDAIINYSKYRHAGIIETEAALKAARICIAQHRNLDVAMFLQNVLYINLNMSEQERVHRFETLTQLYQDIGYHRKAAFCQRLAAWRHVAQSNASPDWTQNYRLMLDSFGGHRLALDPLEVLRNDAGWPCLQIDLLQQLVFAAKRLGQSALATRHMTFLLQTMWRHMSADERREAALQLQSLSAQCEGSPVPLVLESGTIIPPANLTDLPLCDQFVVRELPAHLRPLKLHRDKVQSSPFLFTPIHFNSTVDRRGAKQKQTDRRIAFQWVQHDMGDVVVRLRNPLPFELAIGDMRLLTNGVVFESLPETLILAPGQPTLVTMRGTPIEHGSLEMLGYSTHALGVKSNCRLKAMQHEGAVFPSHYALDVIPALPTMRVSTSLPQSATFSPAANADTVTVTASLIVCNGERTECVVTLHNNSAVPISHLEESLHGGLDGKQLRRIFEWDAEALQKCLPIGPQQSIDVPVTIFADADFLGPVAVAGGGGSMGLPSMHDQHHGPNSLNTLSVSGHASLPSRVSSPLNTLHRRTELSSSFRSSLGGPASGHSSLATMSLGAGGGAAVAGGSVRQLDVQFRFRYSGGAGEREGYCRQCAVAFGLEFMPSAQVTNWDVLPAEIPSQFYLVLDVINLTAQEMTLNYTASKSIVIEARESCRVPVPVEKCPLERLLAAEQQMEVNHNSLMTSTTDSDMAERACSEHIAEQVRLTWSLAGTETQGICSLRGIALSASMMGLITVAPLQWEIVVDGVVVPAQAEVRCAAGQQVLVGVRICNLSPTVLHALQLTIQFYQDYQNGLHNYKLETRVILSGPDRITIPVLGRNATASHECSAIFFTPGRFKADIQCVSQQPSAAIGRRHNPPSHSTGAAAAYGHQSTNYGHALGHPIMGPSRAIAANADADVQVWRLIPPLDITVTE